MGQTKKTGGVTLVLVTEGAPVRWVGCGGECRFLKVYQAEPYLSFVFEFFVGGQGSMTKLIQHSPDIGRIFNAKIRDMEEPQVKGPHMRNLNFVKPRFNSTQAPLARMVLFFDAVFATAVEVALVRAGREPAERALAWLEGLTEEAFIQAAMIADAGEENLRITRYFDSEDYDLSTMPASIHEFLTAINFLFIAEPPGCLKVGYTAHAIALLSKARVFLKGTAVHTVGGPHKVVHRMLERCRARMACWVKLAIQCINLEFPAWLPLHSFCVFDLSGRTVGMGTNTDFHQTCFARLAKMFAVDAAQLQSEYLRCGSYAMSQFRMAGGGKSCPSWVAAVTKPGAGLRLGTSALMKILHVFQAWDGMTTSGIEQTFSRVKRVVGPHKELLTDENMLSEIIVMCGFGEDSAFKANVISEAQKIWEQTWGPPRAAGSANRKRHFSVSAAACPAPAAACSASAPSLAAACPAPVAACPTHTGAYPPLAAACSAPAAACSAPVAACPTARRPCSQRAWTRSRAAHVAHGKVILAQNMRADMEEDAMRVAEPMWGDQVDETNAKLAARALASKGLAAVTPSSAMLCGEVDDDTMALGATAIKAREKLDRAADNRKARVNRLLAGLDRPSLATASVHVAADLGPSVVALAQSIGMRHTTEPHKAKYFVVRDPMTPGPVTLLAAALLGGAVVTPEYLSGHGVRVSYNAALATKRTVWASPCCVLSNTTFMDTLRCCVSSLGSKWLWRDNLDAVAEFCARQEAKPVRLRRPMDFLLLVTDAEKGNEASRQSPTHNCPPPQCSGPFAHT